jgi:uncharacterized protein YuzE
MSSTDPDAATYLSIRPLRPGQIVHRTAEVIADDMLVDFDEGGMVLGIERLGGPMDFDAFVAVIRCLREDADPLDRRADEIEGKTDDQR